MIIPHEPKEREALRQHAAEALKGLYQGEAVASPWVGGRQAGLRRLEALDIDRYNREHNGAHQEATSGLSPYIRHGLITLREARDSVVSRFGAAASRNFVIQLLWRVYWYLRARQRGVASLVDAAAGATEIPVPQVASSPLCIDEALRCLRATGFLAYHPRLWVASYFLHWLGIPWRQGYRLFQEHLIDADPIVNALSWRWVLGEETGRPYFFTRAQVERCTGGQLCARCTIYRCPFEGTPEAVEERARQPRRLFR
ncbi:MAG TPA: FAD-binding domain-containing protein [Armatimonadota bacterium]|nr:FAD-binding domain-containing protein [Armatimonadota bacterium]HOM81676.1 FAD-binding domain-containing protein [Armatimonadota bacterium]HPO72297.1 FAD-binding domain-containing protein [Armatimonadota bacterium]HPU00177.1 FAD-binding domain-containing protein [Armatimonadota bacterium]